jgi:hypothetical protein
MKKPVSHRRILSVACILALAGLCLMVWSLFDPRPLQVVGAMSVGQGFGTLSFVLFLYVVARDLRPGLAKALDAIESAPEEKS